VFRVMTKRGVLLENEFRYLEPTYRGTLNYDVIGNDRQADQSRDYIGVRHSYAAPNGISGGINYNRVSDDNYFVDFSNTIVASSQKVLPQDAFVSYAQPFWNGAVRVTKNQTLQDPLAPVTKPYERVPQTTISGFIADWRGAEAGVVVDGTLTHPARNQPLLHRAAIAYPILAPGWFVIPRPAPATACDLDSRCIRTTPPRRARCRS
jgi:LPS-assembly protein